MKSVKAKLGIAITCGFATLLSTSLSLFAQSEEPKESSLETAIRNLAKAPVDEQKALKAKIKKLLQNQCDNHFESQQNRIDQIESFLASMKKELESQKATRDKQVSKRLNAIVKHTVHSTLDEIDFRGLSGAIFATSSDNFSPSLLGAEKIVSLKLPGMT